MAGHWASSISPMKHFLFAFIYQNKDQLSNIAVLLQVSTGSNIWFFIIHEAICLLLPSHEQLSNSYHNNFTVICIWDNINDLLFFYNYYEEPLKQFWLSFTEPRCFCGWKPHIGVVFLGKLGQSSGWKSVNCPLKSGRHASGESTQELKSWKI